MEFTQLRREAGFGVCAAVAFLAAIIVTRASSADVPVTSDPFPIAAWQEPSREMRPVARWWWPGGSVEPAVLARQLQQLKDAGFGAVELQPLLLGLGEADLLADSKLRSVGKPAFRRSVAAAAFAAAKIGLDFDLTLGSGWPGGLPTPKANAERQLLMGTLDVTGPAHFDGDFPEAPDQSYRRAVEWVLDLLGPPDPDVEVVIPTPAPMFPNRRGSSPPGASIS